MTITDSRRGASMNHGMASLHGKTSLIRLGAASPTIWDFMEPRASA